MSRKKSVTWIALILGAVIALAPALAEARAGGSSSSGSRGARTQQAVPSTPTAPQAKPMERSATTPAAPSRPAQAAAPAAAGAQQPGFLQRNPFMAGMLGGLIGVGLGGLLFGSGLFGEGGLGGIAGFLGLLLQGALIAGVVYLAIAWFRRRQAGNAEAPRPAYAYAGPAETPAAGNTMERRATMDVAPLDIATGKTGAAPAAPASSYSGGPSNDAIGLTEKDYAAFEQLLIGIQAAWSEGDVGKLRAHLTPEMLSYFSEQLSANASSGIANRVEDVVFDNGDLAEAWNEGGMEYATVAMRWRARDYTTRLDTGAVIEGDATTPVEQTEVWTFLRTNTHEAPNGRWLLSAIQQV
jgi:predicted lipid-binding transport protein (Tim44 family)